MGIKTQTLASLILLPAGVGALAISNLINNYKGEAKQIDKDGVYSLEKKDLNEDGREDYLFSSETNRFVFLSEKSGTYRLNFEYKEN